MSVIVWKYLGAYLGACCFGGWLIVGVLLWLMRWLIGLDTKGSFDRLCCCSAAQNASLP